MSFSEFYKRGTLEIKLQSIHDLRKDVRYKSLHDLKTGFDFSFRVRLVSETDSKKDLENFDQLLSLEDNVFVTTDSLTDELHLYLCVVQKKKVSHHQERILLKNCDLIDQENKIWSIRFTSEMTNKRIFEEEEERKGEGEFELTFELLFTANMDSENILKSFPSQTGEHRTPILIELSNFTMIFEEGLKELQKEKAYRDGLIEYFIVFMLDNQRQEIRCNERGINQTSIFFINSNLEMKINVSY